MNIKRKRRERGAYETGDGVRSWKIKQGIAQNEQIHKTKSMLHIQADCKSNEVKARQRRSGPSPYRMRGRNHPELRKSESPELKSLLKLLESGGRCRRERKKEENEE